MSDFNRMTIAAASEVVSSYCTHRDMNMLEIEWGIEDKVDASSKMARAVSWARVAIKDNVYVMTEQGQVTLARAIIQKAVLAPKSERGNSWAKLIAGLRFDGFELVEPVQSTSTGRSWIDPIGGEQESSQITLTRMLPEDIPGLDFREAKDEVSELLIEFGFNTAKGHLDQAVSAFQRGEWSSSNGELRNFFENYLNEIADALGYSGKNDSKLKRDFLGKADVAFLFTEYNEWHSNNHRPQYVQGLMNRMHPHGGHPGLSEEEDATFRLQIMLITARLFLRRYKQRKDNL